MAASPTKQRVAQRGLALIVVLWMLTLLMIMASSFSLTIRRETAVLTDVKAVAQARALAEGGINIAMLNLLPPDEKLRWRSDATLYEITYADAPIRIRISDESGKIDINYADPKMLQGVFNQLGLEEEPLAALLAAIVDWRDADDIQSPNGAEKEQYKKAGLKFSPANKPFESIEELQMVMGMKPEFYTQVEPLLTVYSNSNAVNPAKASREVLLTFPNVTPEMVDSYMQQRAENARAGLPELAPTWTAPSPNASQVYEVLAEAMPVEGITGAVSAVIRRGPSRQQLPFSILKWQKSGVESSLFAEAENNQVIVQ
ncbi:MAG: general secretion pathway protein GspK [Methylococcaceae bacterium]|nr:general secretion pathway protein GspK [Methylococcaceae bacterium]